MRTHDLKETRAQKVARMRAIHDAARGENRDFSEAENTEFTTLETETRALETQIQRAETLAEFERRDHADPVTGAGGIGELERRVSILNVIRAQTLQQPLTGAELEYSRETERRLGRAPQGAYVPLSALERRVNLTTTAPEIVPVEHRPDQFIGPFRERLIVRRLGARVLSGLRGDLSIPKYGTGLSAAWVSENEAVPESNMTFDGVALSPKHVGGLTELSRQLIQQSSPDVEQLVRDDLAAVVAEKIDAAVIDGGATAKEPTGVLRTSGVLVGTLAGPTWAQVLAMIGSMDDRNVPGPLTWLTSGKVSRVLRGKLREAGLPGYLLEGGRMGDVSAVSSGLVPNASSTLGTAVLGDFSQIMLGIWSELDILVNPYAEVPYRRGGVLVRAMATVDTAVRRPESFIKATDVPIPA